MHISPFSFLPIVLLLVVAPAIPASAQSDYSLDGYATAGARVEISSPDGGTGWSLTGTVSQPITGQASVSEYSLEVDSWSFITRSSHIILSDGFEGTTQ